MFTDPSAGITDSSLNGLATGNDDLFAACCLKRVYECFDGVAGRERERDVPEVYDSLYQYNVGELVQGAEYSDSTTMFGTNRI
ncbi:hypothetical protein FRB93_002051 [Tulasnella sp. JGI-2019a]|nr:hypothetical protein FRB93_002051 [Tulasnella sp. JGI-2019a]